MKTKQQKRSPEEWQKIISDQKESKEPLKEFCKKNGISASNFYVQKSRLEVKEKIEMPKSTPPQKQPAKKSESAKPENIVTINCGDLTVSIESAKPDFVVDMVRKLRAG